MIPKKIDDIDFEAFQALIDEAVPEGRTLDYKRDLPGHSDSEKKEFLSDVASLANSGGGDLIFGLGDKKDEKGLNTGTPEMVGLPTINFDQETQRLQNMIFFGIEPKIPPVQIKFCTSGDGTHVGLVRVLKSWFPPHMVVYKSTPPFFSRNSAGKHSMDVIEIRSAFVAGESLKQKIENFRSDRLNNVVSDQVAFQLTSPSRVVTHFVPYNSFEGAAINLTQLGTLSPPFNRGYSSRYNFDGTLMTARTSNGGEVMSYVQVYRDGKLEIVDCGTLSSLNERGYIPHVSLEDTMIGVVNQAISFYRAQDVACPVVLMLSLLNVEGAKIKIDPYRGDSGDPIQEQHLILPELVFEPQWETHSDQILRPAFDLIWNACGYEKCRNFDAQGNWNPPKR